MKRRVLGDDRVVHQAASLCLDYPDDTLAERLPVLREALAENAESPRVEGLRRLVGHLEAHPLDELQRGYVEVFDLTRKHTLYLSYWTDGDTRRRGEVLGRFKAAYRRSGFLVDTRGELPDYLPMVLEFAAVADPAAGKALLEEFRPSLELIRLSLEEVGTPYAAAVAAVCDTLPGPSPGDRAAVMAMAAGSPPTESVGLEPYDPRLLPDPTHGGRVVNTVLWGVLPYVMAVVLVAGTVWRYRYDKFGWTTRSSQLYESRLLRIGSPLFHFGILLVLVGHIGGLVIPESWTEAVGVSEGVYHFNALLFGGLAGVCTLVGILILVYRRRTTGPVFMATTKNDKLMYVVLVAAITLGLWTTLVSVGAGHDAHNYRESVSPWFRSLFVLQPDVESMAEAPIQFHVHTLVGMLLFTIWPFTRLVHAFTAPVHYLFRPYIVYRSRDARAVGARPARAGWGAVGTPDRDRSG